MAMLAEKKRREKWCFNPRGKQWSDDQTKFGQRLLEKMGWSAGQGLGVNKQGPTEIISVKKKDNYKGLGFKENGEEWIKTTSDYNELLDQLASTEGSENDQTEITSSLEDRSKKSKARVHYHKFTRGKDLSRYSEKDLASIIGPDVVRTKSDSDNRTDYNQNQINKGSSTDYFNSKKGVEQLHTPEINEQTTNHDGIVKEKSISGLLKKHKKRNKSCKDDIEEPNCEIETISKKHKKQKIIEEVDSKFQVDVDLSKKKQTKEKNNNSENENECESEVKLKTIDPSIQIEEAIANLNDGTEIKKVSKKKKKGKDLQTIDSVESEVDPSTVQPSKLQKESGTYDKLQKNKRKSNPKITDEVNDIKKDLNINENTTNQNGIVDEESTLCLVKKHKKRKKACKDDIQLNEEPYFDTVVASKKHKKQKLMEEVDNKCLDDIDISNKKQAKGKNKENIIKIENEAELQLKILEPSGQYEESNINLNTEIKKVTKKKKKAKLLNKVDSVEQEADNSIVQYELQKVKVEENKPEKTKKSKKKVDCSDNFVEDSVNLEIKRRKVKKHNYEEDSKTTNNDEPNDEHIQYSNPGKKLKSRSRQLEIEGSIFGAGKELKNEKIDSRNEENEMKTEMTPLNNKKDCPANLPNVFLTANGRQTRLRQINKHHNQMISEKIETEDFMSFDEKVNCSLTENINCDNKWTNEIVESLLPKMYVDPNNHNCKMPASVANYEFRLLRQQIKDLNIPSVALRIVIKNSMSISKKLRKSLKLYYKSKYLKTILPKDVVANIEVAVANMDAQLQPKINMFNELLKLENQTGKLASEIQESSDNLADSRKENLDEVKPSQSSYPLKKEKLKELKKQLKLITKGGEETVRSVLENNQGITDKNETKTDSSPLKYNNTYKETENRSNNSTLDECVAHKNSLQIRIEEKIKTLTSQIKLLKEGKKLPMENENNGQNNEDPFIKPKEVLKRSFIRGQSHNNSWKRKLNNQESYGDMSTKKYVKTVDFRNDNTNYFRSNIKDPNMEQAAFRGQLRGGGRGSWGMGFGLGQTARGGQIGGRGSDVMGFRRRQVVSKGQMRGGKRGSWGMGFGLEQTVSRGQSKGLGRTVVRGRISKNNFDAKQYAEKCKILNKVPEIAFKGVDLKCISGYAGDKKGTPTIESSIL